MAVSQGAAADERAPVAQWVGFFLAPAVFFAHLQISYVLVRWACITHGDVWIHVVDLASIALAGTGTVVAWRTHARASGDQPNDAGGAVPRTRFIGVVGICTSAMFVLLLIAQWVAALFISSCQ